ncbi:hypothetical protein [Bradyrhizobium sp.]|uniref:hypothetical protein n=1 Tax=Bradyrhizobium sp. TaxID=376 RepID=UPI003BB159DF
MSVVHEAIVGIFQICFLSKENRCASFETEEGNFLVVSFGANAHLNEPFRKSPGLGRLHEPGLCFFGEEPPFRRRRGRELEHRFFRANKPSGFQGGILAQAQRIAYEIQQIDRASGVVCASAFSLGCPCPGLGCGARAFACLCRSACRQLIEGGDDDNTEASRSALSKRCFWLGFAAYLVPTFPIAYVWHLVLFAPTYEALGIYRPDPIIPFGFASMVIQSVIFSWTYPRLFPGRGKLPPSRTYDF